MKIQIRAEGRNINLAFPTNWLCSKPAVYIACKLGRRYAGDAMGNISPQAMESLCAELRCTKKRCGKWELVDVEAATGETVKIIL